MNEKQPDLRKMALDTILQYDKTGKKLDSLVHGELARHPELTPAQKGFFVRLTQGTVENRIRLDYQIAAYSSMPVKKIRPVILWILRMGTYQIGEMDSVPASAIVNEAVKLTERRGFRSLKGYVNAVLRSMIREPERVTWPKKEEDPVRYLSVTASLPEYLTEKWIRDYGVDKAEKICRSFSVQRPFTVHIRQTDNEEEKTLALLEQEGAAPEPAPWPKHAWFLPGLASVSESAAFREGCFFVQDASSQLAVFAAGLKEGERVLDVCAAPGGKSLLAADLLKGTGSVTARDLSESRVRMLEENAKRCGFANLRTEVRDALDPGPDDLYDVVLVDAPCSGYGVIGRKPDIRYTASEEKERGLAELQRKILHAAAKKVRPGGRLIYSTCTFTETENARNAQWFLENHDFEPYPIGNHLPEVFSGTGSSLQLLPDAFHDGFYIAGFLRGHSIDVSE